MNVNGVVESSWRELGVKAAAVGRGQGGNAKSEVLIFSLKTILQTTSNRLK